MAIDTREKKRSMMARTMPWRTESIPLPTASFSAANKAQMLYRYSQAFAGAIASLGVNIVASTRDVIQSFIGIVEKIQSTAKIR